MWIETKRFLSLAVLAGVLGGASLLSSQDKTPDQEKRRSVTVADAIQASRVAGTGYPSFSPKSGFAVFSPDGSQFAIVISKGNIEKNTNDYSLMLFPTSRIFSAPIPRILTSFSSSSNRDGIFGLSWSKNNDTLFFLAGRSNEATQLYSIRAGSGKVMGLTSHRTSLVSYAVSQVGGRIVYAAEAPETNIDTEETLRNGIHVTTQSLADLIRGKVFTHEPQLFLKGSGANGDKRLRTQDPFDSGINNLFLSPDGRYLIVKTDTTEVPESWSQYEDPSIQVAFRRKLSKGFPTRILRYELIDTRTGSSEVLLDSPTTYSPSDVLWSPDSKSVLLCGVFLPLNVEDPVELQSRRSTKFVVEIRLPTRTVIKIAQDNEDLLPIYWDTRTNIVQFRARQNLDQGSLSSDRVCYRRARTAWERVEPDSCMTNDAQPDIQVQVEEDLNLPPRIVAVDPGTKQKKTLMDLNPQFAGLTFGKVEEIKWKDGTGSPVTGGLYLPPDFTAGVRYPLVIQTHGFDPHGFRIDGPYTTSFAAQPLANKRIVVLQVNDIFYDSLVTPKEPERAMSAYENVIELLDERGMIDRNKVGLLGFSRTCLYVKYTLTHSRMRFAAAIASDGVDGGYLQYLLFSNHSPYSSSEFDSIMGAAPFGPGLSAWLKRSPGFMLDTVRTPLRLEAHGPPSLLSEWEWFTGLRRLNKPVDLVYLPAGAHILVKPWERMISQEGAVDWFCFWLKDEEDPSPAKKEQYERWRELRTKAANFASAN